MHKQLIHTVKTLTDAKDATLKGKHGRKQAKEFAEVTTPIWCIEKQLDLLPDDAFEINKRVLDPCTGDGRYLMCYLARRADLIANASDLKTALSTLHGVDLQADNVELAKANLMKLCHKIAQVKGFEFDLWGLLSVLNIRQGDFIART